LPVSFSVQIIYRIVSYRTNQSNATSWLRLTLVGDVRWRHHPGMFSTIRSSDDVIDADVRDVVNEQHCIETISLHHLSITSTSLAIIIRSPWKAVLPGRMSVCPSIWASNSKTKKHRRTKVRANVPVGWSKRCVNFQFKTSSKIKLKTTTLISFKRGLRGDKAIKYCQFKFKTIKCCMCIAGRMAASYVGIACLPSSEILCFPPFVGWFVCPSKKKKYS